MRTLDRSQRELIKIVALVTMLIDHIGYMFGNLSFSEEFRIIGRMSFPLFCFGIYLGFINTSNRKKYMLRLLIFSIIFQVPYMFFNPSLHPKFLKINVGFVLLFGLIAIISIDRAKRINGTKRAIYIIFALAVILFPSLYNLFLSKYSASFSYGTYGILLIVSFYLFENRYFELLLCFIVLTIINNIFDYYVYLLQMSLSYKDAFDFLVNRGEFYELILSKQIYSVFSLFIIKMVSLGDGTRIRLRRYFSYFFYPVHILILIFIKACL